MGVTMLGPTMGNMMECRNTRTSSMHNGDLMLIYIYKVLLFWLDLFYNDDRSSARAGRGYARQCNAIGYFASSVSHWLN